MNLYYIGALAAATVCGYLLQYYRQLSQATGLVLQLHSTTTNVY